MDDLFLVNTEHTGRRFYRNYWERKCLHLKWDQVIGKQEHGSDIKRPDKASMPTIGASRSHAPLSCGWVRTLNALKETLVDDSRDVARLAQRLRPFPNEGRYKDESRLKRNQKRHQSQSRQSQTNLHDESSHSSSLVTGKTPCLIHGHDVRLAKTEDGSERTYKQDGQPTSCDEIKMAWTEGFTVVVPRICRIYEELRNLRNRLEAETEQLVSCNIYVTPRGRLQGLKVHYDDHCVIILQVDGSKHWRVASGWSRVDIPRLGSRRKPIELQTGDIDPSSLETASSSPWKSFEMAPGDFLYIPRGCPHFAISAMDVPSVHITVAIENEPHCSWESIFHLAVLDWYHSSKSSLKESMIIVLLHIAIRLVSNSESVFRKACLGKDVEGFETYCELAHILFDERTSPARKKQKSQHGELDIFTSKFQRITFWEVLKNLFALLQADGEGLTWLEWILEIEGKILLDKSEGNNSDTKKLCSAYDCKGVDELEVKVANYLSRIREGGDTFDHEKSAFNANVRAFCLYQAKRGCDKVYWGRLNNMRRSTWQHFRHRRAR